MTRMTGIKRFLRITRNRAGIERAVDDELFFHFDMTMRELMANGMTPDEARKETERRFGDVQRTRERLATIDRSLAGQARRAADLSFSDEVQVEDLTICEDVQRGLSSGSYVAGRLNPLRENAVHHFHELLRATYRDGA